MVQPPMQKAAKGRGPVKELKTNDVLAERVTAWKGGTPRVWSPKTTV